MNRVLKAFGLLSLGKLIMAQYIFSTEMFSFSLFLIY